MAYAHTVTYTWSSPSDTSVVTAAAAMSGDGYNSRTVTILSGADGTEVDVAWINANLKMLYLLSNKALTIFSNVDGGAGNDTVAVAANIPIIYHAATGQVNPFATANVTKIFCDNASGADATLEIRVLVDSTP